MFFSLGQLGGVGGFLPSGPLENRAHENEATLAGVASIMRESQQFAFIASFVCAVRRGV